MHKLKAKFNVDKIVNGDAIYSSDFVDLALKYENKLIEVEEEILGGYELELEGGTYSLSGEELIFNEVTSGAVMYTEEAKALLEKQREVKKLFGLGDMVLVAKGRQTIFYEIIKLEEGFAWISDGYVQITKPYTELTLICKAENRQDKKVPYKEYRK